MFSNPADNSSVLHVRDFMVLAVSPLKKAMKQPHPKPGLNGTTNHDSSQMLQFQWLDTEHV